MYLEKLTQRGFYVPDDQTAMDWIVE